MKRELFILVFLCRTAMVFGQSFDWVDANGSKRNDDCLGVFDGNLGYLSLNMFSDSFSISNDQYNVPNSPFQSFYWLFRENNGYVRKVVKIEQDSIYKRYCKVLDNGRYFLTLDYSLWDSFYLNGVHINSKTEFPIIELDTFGHVRRFNQLPIKSLNKYQFRPTIHIENSGDNILCLFRVPKHNTILLGSDTIKGQDSGYCAVLFDSSGQIIKYRIYSLGLFPWAMEKCSANKFRVLSNFTDPSDSFNYGNDKFMFEEKFNTYTHIIDHDLNITRLIKLPGGNFNSRSISTIGENSFFYNADYFIDNADDTVTIGYNRYSVKKGRHAFIVYYSNGKFKFSKELTTYNTTNINPIQGLTFFRSGEFCAVGGQIVNPLMILPDSLVVISSLNDANIFGMKLDTFGNVLWHFVADSKSSSDGFRDLYLDNRGALFSGYFNKTVKLNNDSFPSRGLSDALLIKITDNSIIRGAVSEGPYCAGDSIFIPYRAYGKYNDTNSFFAELSDENGNFYGTPRLLGVLKSDTSGTIRGILPMFDVISSKNYRIRVRSNSPFVQSFMRYDSLHLLIYSRDKANPGPDTSICYGHRVKLEAKGGTLWHWSPGNMVADSTSRVTDFLGLETAKMTIMIADSSGCGDPDTAFQLITVISPPQIQVNDTVVCRNTEFQLLPNSVGGLQDSMKYFWYAGGNLLAQDTLKSSIWTDSAFTLVAVDGCSAINDTARIMVSLPPPPNIFNRDTILCQGISAKLSGAGSSYFGGPIKFSWYYNNSLVMDDTLHLVPDSNRTFSLRADDGCAVALGAKNININVFPRPTFYSNWDSLCARDSHRIELKTLTAIPPVNYWVNGTSTDSVFTVAAKKKQMIMAWISDGCNLNSTKDTIVLHQKPRASVSAFPDSGCDPLDFELISGNQGKCDQYWVLPDGTQMQSLNDSMRITNAKTGSYVYSVILSNESCDDTFGLTITVFPKPVAKLEIGRRNLLVEDAQTRILNASEPAKQFIWFWDNYTRTDIVPDTLTIYVKDTGRISIRLIAENHYGCRDTADDFIYVHPQPVIWIPTGLTLNNDGLNETLIPGGVGIMSYRFIVLNKWGEVVFRGSENEPWSPREWILPGLYVYRCIYSNWHGTKFEQDGIILLIR